MLPSPPPPPTITPATPSDAPALTSLIHSAYKKYIPRIGHPPAPMLIDYSALLLSPSPNTSMHVLRSPLPSPSSLTTTTTTTPPPPLLGTITLHHTPSTKTLHISNVAVAPAAQGKGYGGMLIRFAEAEAKGMGCEGVELYTNVAMVENVGVYLGMGYVETGRGEEGGWKRVYFRKGVV